jgi:hypothetical protein
MGAFTAIAPPPSSEIAGCRLVHRHPPRLFARLGGPSRCGGSLLPRRLPVLERSSPQDSPAHLARGLGVPPRLLALPGGSPPAQGPLDIWRQRASGLRPAGRPTRHRLPSPARPGARDWPSGASRHEDFQHCDAYEVKDQTTVTYPPSYDACASICGDNSEYSGEWLSYTMRYPSIARSAWPSSLPSSFSYSPGAFAATGGSGASRAGLFRCCRAEPWPLRAGARRAPLHWSSSSRVMAAVVLALAFRSMMGIGTTSIAPAYGTVRDVIRGEDRLHAAPY